LSTPIFNVFWGYSGYFIPKASEEEIKNWNDENHMITRNGNLLVLMTINNNLFDY
jgi:hypothetical protein